MPMPAMEAYVDSRNGTGFTVIGPCPGCSIWTLEYDHNVIAPMHPEGLFHNVEEFRDAVEVILEEHLAECPGLQEIVAALG